MSRIWNTIISRIWNNAVPRKDNLNQSTSSGDNSLLVQAGRDAILNVSKSPPNIKLVKVTIEDDTEYRRLRQKINIIIKNNGGTSTFLLSGFIICTGSAKIVNCNNINMRYKLSAADWTYDVNIDDNEPQFAGKHIIEPNEVVNFNIMVARERGSHEVTIYRAFVRLIFDEGDMLETSSFYLRISGPSVFEAGFVPYGPSPDEWGRCMADNIRRLDKIGYDFRPNIDPNSRKYVEAVAPELFDRDP